MNPLLENYISEYLTDTLFVPDDIFDLNINGLEIHVESYVYDGEARCKEKAHVTIKKGSLTYEYTAIDDHNWENTFHSVTVDGIEYLCFRKTLYGFTLLNTATFEVFDFFPEKVLCGEESYIFVEAVSFGDFIIFDGCYWGSPYVFFIYDHKNERFLDLFHAAGLYSAGDVPGATVHDHILTLKCKNKRHLPDTVTFTLEELRRIMTEKGISLYTDF